MLRKIAGTLILVPLAIVLVAFAVVNRQFVTLSFDPFDAAQPAYSQPVWLFVPIFAALILGVVIGGVGAWLGQRRWRSVARRLDREALELRAKIDALQQATAEPSIVPREQNPPPRLRLRAPAR